MRHQSAIAVIVASLLTAACVPPGPGMMRPTPYGYNSGAMPPAHWDCNGKMRHKLGSCCGGKRAA